MKPLLRRLRGVRVAPRDPAPSPIALEEWRRVVSSFGDAGPCVMGATGGSGTRVVARVVRAGGMFIGDDLNRSEDALDFAAFSDRWVNVAVAGSRPPELTGELRALVARQWRRRPDDARAWGWKEPRSVYLLPILDAELPGLRYLHVVRDGRDMAYSSNQVQLRKHGDAVVGEDTGDAEALRSIALWSEVNLGAAEYGERELGPRYLRIRFEDLCADPVSAVQEIFAFFGLHGDVDRIAATEVEAPVTIGRWRTKDPETIDALERRAGAALQRFGYQSSSA